MKKVVKHYTEEDFLFDPLQSCIEELSEFEDCCAVSILSGFPNDQTAKNEIADLVRDSKYAATEAERYAEIYEGPEPYARESALRDLFEASPVILATTIPSQKYAIRVLSALGFEALDVFKGKTGNRITLWRLRKG